jgi:transcription initiation factor TFIID subunit 2
MKSLFTRMFCCKSCPNIVKTNTFISFQSYFLQKVFQLSHVTLINVDHETKSVCLNI